MSLVGAVGFAGNASDPKKTLTSNWDIKLDIENGSMQCGLPLDNIHGAVRLFGGYGKHGFRSRGLLEIDSLMYQGLQLTQLRGPLLMDSTGVVLGVEADRGRRDGSPRTLQAKIFDGTLSLDAAVKSSSDGQFAVAARLERADLLQMSRDLNRRNGQIRGKVNAWLTLRGNRHGMHSWGGKGAVRLFDADIYEVPVMLQTLKLLSIRRPDKTAFTSSDIDFRIRGNHIYMDRIKFTGDAISLRGKGDISLHNSLGAESLAAMTPPELNMQFYTLVGRDEFRIPGISDLLSQASQQILLIRVTGTPDAPNVTQEPLPALKETLEQIFPEAAMVGSRRSR